MAVYFLVCEILPLLLFQVFLMTSVRKYSIANFEASVSLESDTPAVKNSRADSDDTFRHRFSIVKHIGTTVTVIME